MSPKIWLLLILLFACLLTSFLGMVIHGLFTGQPGPGGEIRIHFVAFLLSLLSFFYSFQGLLVFWRPPTFTPLPIYARIFYYGVVSFFSLLIMIGYAMAERSDGAGWATFLLFLNLLIIYLIIMEKDGAGTFLKVDHEDQEERALEAKGPSCLSCKGCLAISGIWFNRFLKFLVLIFLGLMINGAFLAGRGHVAYPPRGQMIDVVLANGQEVRFHVLCERPAGAGEGEPIIWLEPGSNHFIGDFFGMQEELRKANRRFCVYDSLGQGDSGPHPADFEIEYYAELLAALNEREEGDAYKVDGPLLLVGWGGGGPKIYQYASNHPENVAGMVLMDSYPNNYEWDYLQLEENLTDAELQRKRSIDLLGRTMLLNILRGLGAPWGLTPIFIPPSSTFVPQELEPEKRYHLLVDKTWNTQYYLLNHIRRQERENEPFEEMELDPSIPVLHIMSVSENYGNSSAICAEEGASFPSEECDKVLMLERYAFEVRANLTTNSENGTLTLCYGCEQDFPSTRPAFTVQAILDAFGSIQLA